MFGAGAVPASSGIGERRAALASLMRFAGPPVEVGAVRDASVPAPGGPRPVRTYAPPGLGPGPAPGLVYFHGGGLVAGGLDTHDALCRTLCREAACRVVAVDYRLAPEHPFPAAVEDACAALAFVLVEAAAFGIDPARVAIGGDSAGATLATVAAAASRTGPGARPKAQLLLCPVLDAGADTPSRRAFATGYLLDRTLMERDLADYLPGGGDLADPRLSPLRAPDVSDLPETLIHTAAFDPLRDEGAAYAGQLRAAGVAVRHTCHAGMVHHFYGLTGVVPRARAILADIGAELRAALG